MFARLFAFAFPSLSLLLAASLAAQQVVCLSVDNGPALGVNSLGGPAQLAARVQGVQVAIPTTAGMPAAAASAAHQAAFNAAGFTTMRTTPNEFCVTLAPGGAITSGLCYGTDDMGLDLDSDVHAAPLAPGGVVDPATKPGGAVVPLPPVNQPPLPWSGQITICFWVWIGPLHVRICITITLPANQPGFALGQYVRQQLQQQGFVGNVITMQHPWLPQTMDVLQIERTMAGDRVDGVEYTYDALSRRILPNVTGAGLPAIYGGYEYGLPSAGFATGPLWSHLQGRPQVGSFFDVFHQVDLPNTIGGMVLGTGKTALPVFNGQLLVDPNGMVIELGLTSPTGGLQRHWTIPPTPTLAGFPLHSQGFAFSNGQITMATGIAAILAP